MCKQLANVIKMEAWGVKWAMSLVIPSVTVRKGIVIEVRIHIHYLNQWGGDILQQSYCQQVATCEDLSSDRAQGNIVICDQSCYKNTKGQL